MIGFSFLIFLFFIFQVTGTLGKICSWLAPKTKSDRLEVFLTKLVHLDQLFSVYYQSYPKRIFISIFLALSVIIFSALGYLGSLGLASSLIGRVKQFTWVALGLTLGWFTAFKVNNLKPESLE
jgi:hypothetical protein